MISPENIARVSQILSKLTMNEDGRKLADLVLKTFEQIEMAALEMLDAGQSFTVQLVQKELGKNPIAKSLWLLGNYSEPEVNGLLSGVDASVADLKNKINELYEKKKEPINLVGEAPKSSTVEEFNKGASKIIGQFNEDGGIDFKIVK